MMHCGIAVQETHSSDGMGTAIQNAHWSCDPMYALPTELTVARQKRA